MFRKCGFEKNKKVVFPLAKLCLKYFRILIVSSQHIIILTYSCVIFDDSFRDKSDERPFSACPFEVDPSADFHPHDVALLPNPFQKILRTFKNF